MKRTVVTLVDDLNGEQLLPGQGESISFSFRGANYIIDLSPQHVAEFEAALKPYIDHAQPGESADEPPLIPAWDPPPPPVTPNPPVVERRKIEEPPAPPAPTRTVTPSFRCDICQATFKGNVGLSGHKRLRHGVGGKKATELWQDRRQTAEKPAAKTGPEKPAPAPFLQLVSGLKPGPDIRPGVNVITSTEPRPVVEASVSPARADAAEFDWATITDLQGAAVKLRDRFREGLPDAIQFRYYPEVLAVEGMDFAIVEAALRHPERVEVAPESFDKGYAILRFHRGDAFAVLGLRDPTHPAIIAAYHGSLLENDKHRSHHLTGGGGSSRQEGLPKTARQTVNRLRGLGAKVDWEESSPATVASVSYKGEDLGKISVGPGTPRNTAESDYQRTVRRMAAIDSRATTG